MKGTRLTSLDIWLKRNLLFRKIRRGPNLSEFFIRGEDDLKSVFERGIIDWRSFPGGGGDQEVWCHFRERFGSRIDEIIRSAEQIMSHRFDFLGTGLKSWGSPVDWHYDPTSDHRWPRLFFAELFPVYEIGRVREVKIPYELSRLQHLPALCKAYRLTGDDKYAREVNAQVHDWIHANPFLYGINWTCTMDVSIRIVNLLCAVSFLSSSKPLTDEMSEAVLQATLEHGFYIHRFLECSVGDDGNVNNGNHYLSNVVALLLIGALLPELKASGVWKRIGLNGLLGAMKRQVTPDGFNYESSIAYHRLVVEFFTFAALLCRKLELELPVEFWVKLERMYEILLHLTRPDGRVPQVGDGDDGRLLILSDYGTWDRRDFRYLLSIGAVLFGRVDMKRLSGGFSEEAFWLLGPQGLQRFDELNGNCTSPLKSRGFEAAGFYVLRSNDLYMLACCNELGKNWRGDHKHNDLLSFELSVNEDAFLIDPGTYAYTSNVELRNYFRSTRAHNTVVIDGEEQNEFDENQLFKMKRSSKLMVHEWSSNAEWDRLDAEVERYRMLDQPIRHRRVFVLDKRIGFWKISDSVCGFKQHKAFWYLHVGSDIEVAQVAPLRFRLSGRTSTLEIHCSPSHETLGEVVDDWFSPSYGVKQPSRTIRLSVDFPRSTQMDMVLLPSRSVSSG